jgi:hypothetical protein
MKKVRTKHFIVTGAIGGLLGFFPMEILRDIFPSGGNWTEEILALAFQFAGFGVAVGAALGMTEGFVLRRFPRLIYGLTLGLVLGGLGGFAGGAVGQAIFSLLPEPPIPEPPRTDVAIVLDSSGSMRQERFFWGPGGSDPDGKRRVAARNLIDFLDPKDRVAIIAFSDTATVLLPLTRLDSKEKAHKAVDRVGNYGGTDLNAGLVSSFAELVTKAEDGRAQHVIFLTDGIGEFHETTLRPALQSGIKVYTIGLGSDVDERQLRKIADSTGGRYYPVEDADDLWPAFEAIYEENIRPDMAGAGKDSSDPLLVFILRVLSWGAMGLFTGLGQGVRENTREDLKACTLGGLFGGMIGGAVFEPISGAAFFNTLSFSALSSDDGLFGRCIAEVVVGACIGGSMRMAQGLVEIGSKPRTTFLEILPQSVGLVEMPDSPSRAAAASTPTPLSSQLVEQKGLKGLVLQVKQSVEGGRPAPASQALPTSQSAPMPQPVPTSQPAQKTTAEAPRPASVGRRKPLSFYQSRYGDDRVLAMAKAFQSGHYAIEDVAEHFGVQRGRVVRAIRQHEK